MVQMMHVVKGTASFQSLAIVASYDRQIPSSNHIIKLSPTTTNHYSIQQYTYVVLVYIVLCTYIIDKFCVFLKKKVSKKTNFAKFGKTNRLNLFSRIRLRQSSRMPNSPNAEFGPNSDSGRIINLEQYLLINADQQLAITYYIAIKQDYY